MLSRAVGLWQTTLLRAIAGLDIQTTGVIHQAGRDISALPPSERDFGIVFQSYALFPNLTVAKNIAYGLENRKASKAEIQARVTELLELVGLPDQGDKYPAQLSGGQQQRIALARAIATSPGLLLLDEPLSALDAKVRVHLRHEVKELQRRLGITTVMVTHDQEEALTMADRIVVMNHGVIEQVGTPLEIYRDPATSFVADFIGTMNFMPGTVIGPDRVRSAKSTSPAIRRPGTRVRRSPSPCGPRTSWCRASKAAKRTPSTRGSANWSSWAPSTGPRSGLASGAPIDQPQAPSGPTSRSTWSAAWRGRSQGQAISPRRPQCHTAEGARCIRVLSRPTPRHG